MVDLRELPEAELELDLILHVHDEGEGFDEVRGSLCSAACQIIEVRPGEPVSKPKADVEPAADSLLDAVEQLLLPSRAKAIDNSHPGELQA